MGEGGGGSAAEVPTCVGQELDDARLRPAGRAQEEGGRCWGSAAGKALKSCRGAQRCGGDALSRAGPVARTTRQLANARRPQERASPSAIRVRQQQAPGEAERPRRRLTCGRAARARTASAVRTR